MFLFTDVDECENDNGGCGHVCTNTIGSYNCSCRNGYMLHENGHSCKESDCTHTIRLAEGEITSPNWPDNYPKKKDCTWLIIGAAGHRLELEFDEFDLEQHQECAYDHVMIYDGDSEENRILGRYCGNHNPQTVTASSNKMYITLHSDASVSRTGFLAKHYTVLTNLLGFWVAVPNERQSLSVANNSDDDISELLMDELGELNIETCKGREKTSVPKLCVTRWAARVTTLSALLVKYKIVLESMEAIRDRSNGDAKRDAYARMLIDPQFIVALVVAQFILSYCACVTIALQSVNCDLAKAYKDIKLCKEAIRKSHCDDR
uniref:Tolloid-like protein 1-like n=1 Tax=Saccoglossus kowalevskii TaxID=10224 RepID=A0ABM0MSC3_SACKO|nr:PREDICTED: tolloid-like protein 1-like [Saccoglossus kowalevskii]